jgi:ribosome-binding protein aMBF1 (putative translation factor)
MMPKLDDNIAPRIKLAPSMVYKIRRGERYPGFNTMKTIEQLTGWSINEQITARAEGHYSKAFTEVFASSQV